MNGKDKCSYLKAIRREIAAANGIDLEIPECTFDGECSGTCPRCEGEVRQLEKAIAQRRKLSQKVAILGVAAGLSLAGMSPAVAQTEVSCDSTTTVLTAGLVERKVPGYVPISYNRSIGYDIGRTSTVFNFAEKTPLRRIGDAEKPDLSKYDVKSPMFPGGEDEMKRYVRENFTGPEMASDLVADGDVIVEFRVSTKGKVSGVKVKGNADPAVKNALRKVFRSMPLWIPATVNGEVVSGYVQVPITFLRKEE